MLQDLGKGYPPRSLPTDTLQADVMRVMRHLYERAMAGARKALRKLQKPCPFLQFFQTSTRVRKTGARTGVGKLGKPPASRARNALKKPKILGLAGVPWR